MKIPQSRDELMNHLSEQYSFLTSSCKSFDEGNKAEAKRIATTIRVLVHDTRTSKSLLTQLNWKDKMNFFDSSWPLPNVLKLDNAAMAACSLVRTRFTSEGPKFEAPLQDHGIRKVPFSEWWEKYAVLLDKEKRLFTRKMIILSVADQDGGAHVDPELNEDYAKLTRENSFGFMRGSAPMGSPHMEAIRQMGLEVQASIFHKYQEFSKV